MKNQRNNRTFSYNEDFNPIMGAPPSWAYWNLITIQRLHFPFGARVSAYELEEHMQVIAWRMADNG
jgi:hypothetical protein